jgi:hypothetical protein
VGVEPTKDRLAALPGFEVRTPHRERCPSIDFIVLLAARSRPCSPLVPPHTQRGDSFSAAFMRSSSATWAYLSVVWTLLCPRNFCIIRRLMPRWSRDVAQRVDVQLVAEPTQSNSTGHLRPQLLSSRHVFGTYQDPQLAGQREVVERHRPCAIGLRLPGPDPGDMCINLDLGRLPPAQLTAAPSLSRGSAQARSAEHLGSDPSGDRRSCVDPSRRASTLAYARCVARRQLRILFMRTRTQC